MRINKYVALATGLSRRASDQVVADGRVTINGAPAELGSDATPQDQVTLDGRAITIPDETITILLNKPTGIVVSRAGQGSRTVYDLLPDEFKTLKPVGRLDKDSSGLLLLTNDGDLANELTHPSRHKRKQYQVTLDQPLQPLHRQLISEHGIELEDGLSKLMLERQHDGNDNEWIVGMHEGRNRQIRRTFAALGYEVAHLHRTHFGQFELGNLRSGSYIKL